MGIEISDEQRRWRFAHRHRLTASRRTDDVAVITDDLVALHSSDPATVYLTALARMATPSIEAVNRALYEQRSVVRHHAMRRTLWVMTPDVARLAHGAATAKVARAERKRTIAAIEYSTDFGDPEAWLTAAYDEVAALLASEGPLSTRAIGQALPHLVVPLTFGARTKHPAPINGHTKVLQGAGFDAVLVRAEPTGAWNSAEYRWTPTMSWLGQALTGLDEADAAAQLLPRWLAQFGPATETDIAWWFGWTAGLTRASLATIGATAVTLEDGAMGYVVEGDEGPVDDPGPWVRLLPGLDPTAMGWKQRDWYLDPGDVARLFDRFGNAGPTVWVDGKIVGAWIQRADTEIVVELGAKLSPEHQTLLDRAIEELRVPVADVVVRPRFPAPAHKALFG